jgi:hypothetical protein
VSGEIKAEGGKKERKRECEKKVRVSELRRTRRMRRERKGE